MSEEFRFHPASGLERAAKSCALLDNPDDHDAWVKCCTKRFLVMARRIARDDDLAQDALQESWTRVLLHVCKYRGRSPACGWVRTVVANCAKDLCLDREAKRKRRISPLSEEIPDPSQGPEALAQQRELLLLLLAIIDTLPAKYEQVCRLRLIEDRSTDETAQFLGVSRSTVSTRLHRAVEEVKKRLEARLRK